MGVLVIERPKALVGAGVKFHVLVNGSKHCVLKNGQSTTIETNGTAEIVVEYHAMMGSNGRSLRIELGNNEKKRIIVKPGVTGVSGKEAKF